MSTDSVPRGDLKRALGPEAGEYLAQIDGSIEGSPERFAVIKIGGEMAQGDYLEQLSGSVAHLGRLGYLPVLVHGGGPQINERFAKHGIEPEIVEGLRVTTQDGIQAVNEGLSQVNFDLGVALKQQGVAAEGMLSGMNAVFEAEIIDEEKWGLVGTPKGIDFDRIKHIVESGNVPVIACLGQTASGQLVNINGDDAAAKLVEEINPEKFITLTKPGGVKDNSGRMIPNLTQHSAESLIKQGVIEGGMTKKVKAILSLINDGARDDGVLTHPSQIVRELFTHEGAGTLITGDMAINRFDNLNGLDGKRIRGLIEDAFGGHLSEDYFRTLKQNEHGVYITPQRYDGIGIVRIPRANGPLYIDKLAVTPGEQGRGIADEILERIAADATDGLFWRAAPEAVFMQKYENFADEFHNVKASDGKEWTVFFKNMKQHQIKSAMNWALEQPVTIERHPDDAPF